MKANWMGVLILVSGICFSMGCTPESEILFGVWQSKADLSGYSNEEGERWVLPVGMELILGHYGPDVTGVVRFYDTTFSAEDDTWHNEMGALGCACTFVENGKFRKNRRFTFRVDTNTGCLPLAALPLSGNSTAIEFDLELSDDDQVLSGQIRHLNGDGSIQTILFQRDEHHLDISDEDKVCEIP